MIQRAWDRAKYMQHRSRLACRSFTSNNVSMIEHSRSPFPTSCVLMQPSPLPSPSPSPITGPQLLRPIVGECFQFTGKDGNGDENRYEFCGFKSVRQTVVKNGNSYSCGYWSKWNTVQGADGKTKYVSQVYNDGESCGGSVRRQTTVFFKCNDKSDIPELLAAREPEMCQYEIDIALKEWCDVEKELGKQQ